MRAEEQHAKQDDAPATDFKKWYALLRPHRRGLSLLLALMLLQSLASLINPWLGGQLALSIMQGGQLEQLMLAWFALILMQGVLAYITTLRTRIVGAHLAADVGQQVFDRVQSLPLRWHQQRGRGDVLSLLLRDVEYLANFITTTLTPLVPLLLTCFGALWLMARIEPWFAAAAGVLVPAVYLAMRWSGRSLRPMGRALSDARVARSSTVEQSMSFLPVVKSFNGEARESNRHAQRIHSLCEIDIRLARRNALIAPCARVLSAAAVLGLLWFASRQLAAGSMGTDDLVSLLLYGLLLTRPVSSLAGVYGHAHSAHAVAQRLAEVFAAVPESGGSLVPKRIRGDIECRKLSFAYPEGNQLLHELDLHLHVGETVAITGGNGVGKTSLMHLLMRFLEPDAGRILLDGHDLADYDLGVLRSAIALVPQKVLLFNGTVGDNIAYGRMGASDADVWQAVRLAQAERFIRALPGGLDTVVGDDGVRLSGGQRQRIALARALLKDPAVLILDEATAMFDPQGESDFISASRDWLRQRSVLLITHRPAGLALADRVLRLQDGQLRELPRHG